MGNRRVYLTLFLLTALLLMNLAPVVAEGRGMRSSGGLRSPDPRDRESADYSSNPISTSANAREGQLLPGSDFVAVFPGQFVAKIFTEAYGRVPTQAEWETYEGRFTSVDCVQTVKAIAEEIYSSEEFIGDYPDRHSRQAPLLALYRGALNREIDRTSYNRYMDIPYITEPWPYTVHDFFHEWQFTVDELDTLAREKICVLGTYPWYEDVPYDWGDQRPVEMVSCVPWTYPRYLYDGNSGAELQIMLNNAAADPDPEYDHMVYLAQDGNVWLDTTLLIPKGITLATVRIWDDDPFPLPPEKYAYMGRLVRNSSFDAPMVVMQTASSLKGVWVDGQRQQLWNSSFTSIMRANVWILDDGNPEGHPGFTQLISNRLTDPLGRTSATASGSADSLPCGTGDRHIEMAFNLITEYATEHYADNSPSDGLGTNCEDTWVHDNQIVDATDVAIVLGRSDSATDPAPQKSQIYNNTILNAGSSANAAFAADGWRGDCAPGYLLDFTGAHFDNNTIWTTRLKSHLDIIFLLGVLPAYPDACFGTGVTLSGNTTGSEMVWADVPIAVSGMYDVCFQDADANHLDVVKHNFIVCESPGGATLAARSNSGSFKVDPGCTPDLVEVLPLRDCLFHNIASSQVDAQPLYQTAPSFSVSWSSTDPWGVGVESYDIQYRDGEGPWTDWLSHTVVTSSLFTGEDGHIYSFQSRCRDNWGGEEPWPETADTATTVDSTPPSSQVGALSTWQTNSSFSVSWSGSDPVSGIAEYDVQVCTIDCEIPKQAVWEDWVTHITTTSSLFTGGQDGYSYWFRSRARDNAGNLELYPELPDAHTHLDLSAPTSQVSALPTYSPGSFTVSWSGSDSFSGVANYDIQFCVGTCDTPQGAWVDWLSYTTTTSAPFAGDHNTQYHFRCRARDNAGNVEPYPEPGDTSTTVDALPPETSVAALSTYIDQSSFLVSWDGSDGPSGLSYYNVYYRDESQSTWTPWLSGVTLTSTTFFGGPGHTYHFCSQGVDNVGNQEDCPSGAGQPWPIQSDAHTSVQPGSRVNDLPPTVAQTTFLVSWSGSPDVSLYDVQVREGLYGVWTDWKTDVNYTQAEYTGQWGKIYYFRSRGKTMLTQEFWPYDYDTFTKPVMSGALGGGGLPVALLLADEAPDRWEEVTVTQALGVPLVGRIGVEGDVDWYRFEITETTRLRVRLDELPADYDLYVFDGEGRFLWSSTWGRTLPDEVTVRAPAGTYYVQLVGYAGAWNVDSPYRLLVELAK